MKETIVFQSHQIMGGNAMYQGTVYEPFSSTTPAEQSYSPAKAPGGPRRTSISGDDEGWTETPDVGGTDLSPIGDALCPLLLFAAMFCGIIALRRKRSALKG